MGVLANDEHPFIGLLNGTQLALSSAEEATLLCDIFIASGSLAFSTDLLIKVRWGVGGVIDLLAQFVS